MNIIRQIQGIVISCQYEKCLIRLLFPLSIARQTVGEHAARNVLFISHFSAGGSPLLCCFRVSEAEGHNTAAWQLMVGLGLHPLVAPGSSFEVSPLGSANKSCYNHCGEGLCCA